ncbi:hypothetical protein JQX13_00490 [Archangium violaceum]|uniref:hypothetical protein n=1 Tax=Archangium violaceum TaxID=83451 RepID=UPI00193C2F9A|nr:hypothetical protein [Archangium violaceum]QRK08704.1 hypothetical protein JQX13_00490 [Archangium violaceum]
MREHEPRPWQAPSWDTRLHVTPDSLREDVAALALDMAALALDIGERNLRDDASHQRLRRTGSRKAWSGGRRSARDRDPSGRGLQQLVRLSDKLEENAAGGQRG